MKSTKHIASVAAVAALAVAGVTATAFAKDDGGRIKSDMMIGVPAALTGGPGAHPGHQRRRSAWAIGEAEVSVKSSGKVEAEFQNLILPPDRGFGEPVAFDGGRRVVPRRVQQAGQRDVRTVPRHRRGLAGPTRGAMPTSRPSVDLPSPCFAPIVFITNAAGTGWFAVDGL